MGAGRIYSSRRGRILVWGCPVVAVGAAGWRPDRHRRPGDLTLISTSDTGVKGNGSSSRPSISGDGRLVAFISGATNLHPADTDAVQDIYVKDLLTGEVSVVSTTGSGVKGNGNSWDPHIAADGSKVTFYSSASNLDPSDSDTTPDIYVKDLASGDLVLASASATGVKGNANSVGPMLSGNGTMVVFTSDATNLDPADLDTASDVYVKDLLTGELILASTSDTGEKSNDFSTATSIAADGTAVSFFSWATNLDPADTDTLADIYVKNLDTGDLMLASTSSSGEKGNADSYFDSRLSADGDSLVFDAYATNLHPEANGVLQVYLKDLITGKLTLASSTTDGEVAISYTFHAELSSDEASVAFASWAWNLDPSDTDARTDIYLKDLVTGELSLASTNASGVKGDDDSDHPALTADGRSVVFESIADNLDPTDTDTLSDIYREGARLGRRPAESDGHDGRDRGADDVDGTSERRCDLRPRWGRYRSTGSGGDDVICAGPGADVVTAGAGDDSVTGGGGPDRIVGGNGDDTLRGGPGPDVLRGGAGHDTCFGGSGADVGTGCEATSGIP